MARWTGLEPATPCVTGRYSNQLNYHRIFSKHGVPRWTRTIGHIIKSDVLYQLS